MKPIAILLLVGACSSPVEAPVVQVEPVEVSPCKAGVAQSSAPPLPRTIDSIVDAYNRAKAAGLATEAALRECSAKVDLLLKR